MADPTPALDAAKAQQFMRMSETANLTRRMRSGGNTFYWIAALSLVNSLVAIFGGGIYFVTGLGATLFVDGLASGLARELGSSAIILTVGFLISLFIDGIVAMFGYFAGKGNRWAFITGMVFYFLDALLLLAFQDWLAVAFHAYFLWLLWTGLQALGRLKTLTAPAADVNAFPKDFGGA